MCDRRLHVYDSYPTYMSVGAPYHDNLIHSISKNSDLVNAYILDAVIHFDYSGLERLCKSLMGHVYVQGKVMNKILESKHYAALDIILRFSEHEYWNMPLGLAIYLAFMDCDIEALSMILEIALKRHLKLKPHTRLDTFELETFPQALPKTSKEEVSSKLKKMVKMLCAAKNAQGVLEDQDLQHLSRILTKYEFDKFIKANKISISLLQYMKLMELYTVIDFPVVDSLMNVSSAVDVLLKRTYSKAVSVERIRAWYSSLFSIDDQCVQQILALTLINIVNGDDIKIVFVRGSEDIFKSQFNSWNKIIVINVEEIKRCFLGSMEATVPAIIVHEVAHYYFYSLYKNGNKPFSPTVYLRDHRYVDFFDKRELPYDKRSLGFAENQDFTTEFLLGLPTRIFDLQHVANSAVVKQHHNNGLHQVLMYASNLFKGEIIKRVYLNPENYVEDAYRKLPELDLIYANFMSRCAPESDLDIGVQRSLTIIHAQGRFFDQCNSTIYDPLQKEATASLVNRHLSALMSKYRLSVSDVIFLERLSDYTHTHLSQFAPIVNASSNEPQNILYQELVVRYVELKVLFKLGGYTETPLAAYGETLRFWDTHILPDFQNKACEYVDSKHARDVSFDGMPHAVVLSCLLGLNALNISQVCAYAH